MKDNAKRTDSSRSTDHTDTGCKNIGIRNTKTKDSGAKLIFDNHILCAQFLRGYTNVDLLKNVQPEDIEDISERFLWMWQEGRDSDSVKKIYLDGREDAPENTLYLIALIEHQSSVDHDMPFRILRYIVQVLTDYADEQEKKQKTVTKSKNFRYPPILPIVFYDGTGNWTAETNFRNKVHLNDILGEFIPDFRYLVVPLSRYSNQELIDKGDELSLIMLVDKLRSAADFHNLKTIPEEYFENISRNSPESVLKLIGKIISVLLLRMNVPKEEVADFTDRVERRDFTMLFENFEAYDVQETRRISRAEGKTEGRAEGRAEGKAESILELLEEIGPVTADVKERIMREKDPERLRMWLKAAARAESVEQFTADNLGSDRQAGAE